jgi:hypothetical protein
MWPAGRASYAEGGHFVTCVPVEVGLGVSGLAMLGIVFVLLEVRDEDCFLRDA